MTLLYLIRHGHNDHLSQGKLAGRASGVHLSEEGIAQAQRLAETLKHVRLTAVYASPLERAKETAAPIAEAQKLAVKVHEGLNEIDYGSWQGKTLKALRRRKAWPVIQLRPGLARFPDGETFTEAQIRIVSALDDIRKAHPRKNNRVVCCFHSDPIKLAVAHYIGLHLDMFQRLSIAPGSITVLKLQDRDGRLLRMNDTRATRAHGKL